MPVLDGVVGSSYPAQMQTPGPILDLAWEHGYPTCAVISTDTGSGVVNAVWLEDRSGNRFIDAPTWGLLLRRLRAHIATGLTGLSGAQRRDVYTSQAETDRSAGCRKRKK